MTSRGYSQNRYTQYGAVTTSSFKYSLFSVPLCPTVELKWISFRSSLVRQLLRVATIEHKIGGDVNESEIVLDGEDSEMPWNTHVQLCGRLWI